MANHPAVQANPQAAGRDMYQALDIGPNAPLPPPPPVNYPATHAYPAEEIRWELAPGMDAGGRVIIFPDVGHPHGNLTAPYNANVRGIFKRADKKVKPL